MHIFSLNLFLKNFFHKKWIRNIISIMHGLKYAKNPFLLIIPILYVLYTIYVHALCYFPPFWVCQRGRSILSGRVRYTLYICEGEFNHSNPLPLFPCLSKSLRDVLSSSKGREYWVICFQVQSFARWSLVVLMLAIPNVRRCSVESLKTSYLEIFDDGIYHRSYTKAYQIKEIKSQIKC